MRQFTFLSELQRMSVLVKKSPSDDAKQIEVYVKGSPEKIYQLCKPETSKIIFTYYIYSLLLLCLQYLLISSLY